MTTINRRELLQVAAGSLMASGLRPGAALAQGPAPAATAAISPRLVRANGEASCRTM
jgi:hypothetical protein